MRKYLIICAILLLATSAFADVITIGTGTTTYRRPFGMFWGYERSAALYLESEIGVTGTITDLGWYIASLTAHANGPVKIYLKTTTATSLTQTTWADMITGATLVYDNTNTIFTAGGWQTFTLSSSFSYTGDNLLVLVETNYGGTGGEGSTAKAIYHTQYSTYYHEYWYADNSPPTGNGTMDYYRPNIQITITTGPPAAHDIGVQQILTPGATGLVNAPIYPTAKVKNFGTNDETNFAVICSIIGNTTGFLYTNTQTISLASGRDTVISFGSYTPTTAQMCSVIVRSALDGDENPANDRKSKGCDVLPYIYIGTGTSGSTIYTMYCYNQYSVSERIYLQSEIGYYGTINSIAFYKTSGTNVDPIEGVSIYMKHTSEATLGTGAWSLDDYTLVYSGVFTNDNTSGWMEVSLSTPFLYNNFDNLAVLVVRDGPQITTGYPAYQYTSTSPTYMSRYAYSNTAMPTSLTATYYRTNVRFGFTAQTPPTTDAGVRAIIKPGATVMAGASVNPQALIRNYGTAFQPQITVLCSIVGPGKALRYFDSVKVSLSAQKDSVVTLPSWTAPSSPEVCTVKMRTVLAGDADPSNDRKTSTTEVGNYIIIGTGTSSAATYPIYRYYNYSAHEAIYLQSEIGYYGDLTHLAYYKASGTNVDPIDSVKIYMKHTSDTALSAGDYSLDDYTLVYEGQFPNNATEGWMEITLTTPFRYNNVENLQILVLKGYQAYITTYPYWRYTTVPQVRNRYAYSDASLPTTLSYTTTNLPNIRFQMTLQTPPSIDIGVTSILAPLTMLNPRTTTTSPVRAKIRNYSISTQTNIPVCCSIFSQTKAVVYVDHETIPSLGVYDTVTVAFNDWTLPGSGTYTVKVKAYKSGDENPNNDIQTRQTQIPTPYYTGGPDAGYYWWIDSDTLGGPTYNWIDTSGATLLTVATGDDARESVALPFTFTYYDQQYTNIWVCTNGWLSFGADPGINAYNNTSIPDAATPNNAVYPLWDDLAVGPSYNGNIYVKTVGTEPNRKFVVIWQDVRFLGVTDDYITFEVILEETTNDIIFQYADVDVGNTLYNGGASATVGIENSDGTTGLQYLYNGSSAGNLLSAGRAIRLYKYIYANDVGIDEILYPGAMHALNVPMTPKAKVKNYGTTAQSNFQVACTIFGAGNEVRYHSEKFISLAEGRDTTVEFDVWSVPTIEEEVTVKMATGLGGDEFPSNDIKTRTTTIQAVIDVGVASINRPTGTKDNEIKRIPFNPEVTVANYGSQDETEVPVIAEIYYLGGKKQDDKNTAINPEIELATPEKQTFTIDPKTTDAISNMITKVRTNNKSKSIDYSVLWAIPLTHIACVGLTPVCIGDYPAGETLLWVSSGGRTGSGDPNWILIYNLNTRTLVDSFQQATTTTWGYRDMCFYNGYVYAGADAVLHKIDPVTHNVVGTYTVTGISYLRALMDNNVEDSLWTADWNSPIYKFYNQGGAVRQVNTNTYSIYGLAYDASRNCVWGSCQNEPTAHLVKYNYPDFTVADYTAIPELGSGIAGGCEMWGSKLLYLSQASADSVVCIAFPEPIYRDSILVSIPYGKASIDTFFRPCTLWTEGSYLVKAYTKLAGDMEPSNDMQQKDFTVSAPTLTLESPENGSQTNDNTPTFVWNPVEGAELYRIEVDSNPNFTDPVFGGTLGETEIESDPLDDATYYWRVRVESPGTPDPWSEVWTLTIDTQGPEAPVPIGPSGTVTTETPTFIWNKVDDAEVYNLVCVTAAKEVVFDIQTDDTSYVHTEPFTEGNYSWQVRGKDAAENWGAWSDPMSFTVSLGVAGWAQRESMPPLTGVEKWHIKDGGAIVGVPGDPSALYAFRGTKTPDFKKYTLTYGWYGEWSDVAPIPFGYKYKPGATIDSSKFAEKYPGKGAALCYDGDHNTIYAIKGNGLWEFWAYDIANDTWILKPWIPSVKGPKAGSGLAYYDGYVYLLVGSLKLENDYFYRFCVAGDSWEKLTNPSGVLKPWKAGSALCAYNGKIYAMKGGEKPNWFLCYDPTTGWVTPPETLTTFDSVAGGIKKLYVKAGGCMATADDGIYGIKGGGTNTFYKYTPTTGWIQLVSDTIPRLHKKSVPKEGAAMGYVNGRVWLLKGNKTPEFWSYLPPAIVSRPTVTVVTTPTTMVERLTTTDKFSFDVTPNPFERLTTIRYTVPTAGNVTIKLYNASGRLIETLVNEHLAAGNYTLTLSAEKLAKGIYFVKCETSNNSAKVKLIVQ